MGYSQDHIARTKQRIIDHAGALFRKFGYNGVGIDSIMKAAELTRGGFYAHFDSKSDLFNNVISETFNFTRQARKLRGIESEDIDIRAMFAILHYLNHKRRDHIGMACTMASSAVDVLRSGKTAKSAFESRFKELISEMQSLLKDDGVELERNKITAIVSMCVGGLILARACNEEAASDILKSCEEEVQKLVIPEDNPN